jgi:hypothetical protein
MALALLANRRIHHDAAAVRAPDLPSSPVAAPSRDVAGLR